MLLLNISASIPARLAANIAANIAANVVSGFDKVPDYWPALRKGLLLSVSVALASLFFAMALGLSGATMKLSRNGAAKRAASSYSSIVRGVPELVWIYFFYYGIQMLLNSLTKELGWKDIIIDPFWAGVITLGLIYGAYFTETFRGAIMAIPHGQMEASQAFGMTGLQTFRRITFPQLMRFALPGVRNNWLTLTKSTALISVVGLNDLTRIAYEGGRKNHAQFAFFVVSAVLFLMITTVSLLVLRVADRHFAVGTSSKV